jgi:hypothetical protein
MGCGLDTSAVVFSLWYQSSTTDSTASAIAPPKSVGANQTTSPTSTPSPRPLLSLGSNLRWEKIQATVHQQVQVVRHRRPQCITVKICIARSFKIYISRTSNSQNVSPSGLPLLDPSASPSKSPYSDPIITVYEKVKLKNILQELPNIVYFLRTQKNTLSHAFLGCKFRRNSDRSSSRN